MRLTACRWCDSPLPPQERGRPRVVCEECQRFDRAQRQALRRRRRAGLPADIYTLHREPEYWAAHYAGAAGGRGGRERLVYRMARAVADSFLAFIELEPNEWSALRAVMPLLDLGVERAGGDPLEALLASGAAPSEHVLVLRRLVERNAALLAAEQEKTRRAAAEQERQREEEAQAKAKADARYWQEYAARVAGEWLGAPSASGNPFVAALQAIPDERRAAAYKALALVLHPDRGGDAQAMVLLNAARDVVGERRPTASRERPTYRDAH